MSTDNPSSGTVCKQLQGKCSMDIYSPKGTKIIFDCPNNGYPYEKDQCRKVLVVGQIYTVERTEVHSTKTNVWLQEITNGTWFNSVMFSAVPAEPISSLPQTHEPQKGLRKISDGIYTTDMRHSRRIDDQRIQDILNRAGSTRPEMPAKESLSAEEVAIKLLIGRRRNIPWSEVPDSEVEGWKQEAIRITGLQSSPTTPQKPKGEDMKHEVIADQATRGNWRVEAINHSGEGECFVTVFSGPDAEVRAMEYAAWKNS